MTASNVGSDGGTDRPPEEASDDASGEARARGWRRWARAPVAACRWVVDTFRGHSGARQLRNRER